MLHPVGAEEYASGVLMGAGDLRECPNCSQRADAICFLIQNVGCGCVVVWKENLDNRVKYAMLEEL